MKRKGDGPTLRWIFRNSKKQFAPLAVLLLIQILLSVLTVLFALLCREILDSVSAPQKDLSRMLTFAGLLLGLVLFQFLLQLISRNMLERIKAKLEISLKSSLFSSILRKKYGEITGYHSGELLNRLVNDVVVVTDGITTILPGLVSMITKLASAFAALILLDKMFAVIFLVGGVLLFLLTRLFRSLLKRMHKQVQETDGKVRSFLQEALANLLMIKAFSIEQKAQKKADDLQQLHFAARMKQRTVNIFANSGIGLLFQAGYLFSLVFCAYKLFLGVMSFGTLTAILQLVNQVQSPFVNLSGLMPKYYAALASAERIMEIEEMPNESEPCSFSNHGPTEKLDARSFYSSLERVVFSHVSFSYPSSSPVLRDVSFSIERNEFLAVTGLSGIGKSTVLKLLLGVYPTDSGEIFFESAQGRVPVSWQTRELFAYVPQGNFIMSGTIRENLLFVKGDATEEELHWALRISCAQEFLQTLPDGLDTMMNEKGSGLSEGQIQRLAIARAVLSKAPILLLDEVTSALDEETEARLLRNLKELSDITCIIISHKKAAVDLCDKTLTIFNGSVSIA